jgi:hypothetical protein
MQENHGSLIELLNSMGGGAFSTVVGTVLARLMWHGNEARKGHRKFLGVELIWELPVAFGMGMVGEALSSYLSLAQPVSTGLIIALAYMGPRGVAALFEQWCIRKFK